MYIRFLAFLYDIINLEIVYTTLIKEETHPSAIELEKG